MWFEVISYEPLVYHIHWFVKHIGFENVFVLKADATVSIFMVILYYLSGLPNFISIHLSYMYLHTYAFFQVSCVIYYWV